MSSLSEEKVTSVAEGNAGAINLPSPGYRGFFRKYAKVLRVALSERLVYRADFFINTFLRFLPMLTTILLWHAIYAGAEKDSLAGFSLPQMIAYLLLVHISRMFSSMPGLAKTIARDIRDGTLKKYLLQPIDMIYYLVTYRIAHKAAYISMSCIPYAVLFWLCRQFFPGWPDPWTFAAYVAALLMGFLVGFFFEATIGMVGFWFLEVTSFLYIVMTMTYFLSGHMFPLDLLPPFWVNFLKCLPFQYLAYFPAMIFLGKIHGPELVQGLILEAAWAVGLIVLSRFLYRMGLKRYSAYGG